MQPPLDDTPEALRTTNPAAIAKVAALLPANANEADLAPSFACSVPSLACSVAQCIASRTQTEATLRLLRQNADDIGLVIRLNAQYGSLVRTSLSVQGRLMRMQALRHKREATEGAVNQNAWALHSAKRSMLGVMDPDAGPQQAAWPQAARATDVDQEIEESVSEMGRILKTRLLRRS